MSPLDKNPDLLEKHHVCMFEIDLEKTPILLDVDQKTSRSVLCYVTVPAQLSTKMINIMDQKGS